MSGTSRIINDLVGAIIPWKWCNYQTLDSLERSVSDTQTQLKAAVQSSIKLFRETRKDDVLLQSIDEQIPRAVFWFYGVEFRLNHRVIDSLKAVNKVASEKPISSHVAAKLLQRLNTDWLSYQNLLASYGKRVIEVYNINHTDNLLSDVTYCTWEALWTNRVWEGIELNRRIEWEFLSLGKRAGISPNVIPLFEDSFTNVNASGDQLALLSDSVVTQLAAASMTRSAVEDYYNCAQIFDTEWTECRRLASTMLTDTRIHRDAVYYKKMPAPRPVAPPTGTDRFPVSEVLLYMKQIETKLNEVSVLANAVNLSIAILADAVTKASETSLIVADSEPPASRAGDRSIAFAVLSDYASTYVDEAAKKAETEWWKTIDAYSGRLLSPLGPSKTIETYDALCFSAKKGRDQFRADIAALEKSVTAEQVTEWNRERDVRWNITQRVFLSETWRIVGRIADHARSQIDSKDQKDPVAQLRVATTQLHNNLEAIRLVAHPEMPWFHTQFLSENDTRFSGSHRSMTKRYSKTIAALNDQMRIFEQTKDGEPLIVKFSVAANSLVDAAASLDKAREYCRTTFAADIKTHEASCLAVRRGIVTGAVLPVSVSDSLLPKFKTLSQYLRFNSLDLKEIRTLESQFISQIKESRTLLDVITKELKEEKTPKHTRAIQYHSEWQSYVYLITPVPKVATTPPLSPAQAPASAAAAAGGAEAKNFKELEEANTFAQRKRDVEVLRKGVEYAIEIVQWKDYTKRLQLKDKAVEALFEMIGFFFSLKCAHLKVTQRWVSIQS